jgi:peptidoglycan/LPS O-acetylase OafA/YrhL
MKRLGGVELKQPLGHMTQLDGLRGFAALAVVFAHNGNQTVSVALDLGHFGIKLFFVLSGFLITGILLKARAEAAIRDQSRRNVLLVFYVRRFLRIFPLYYLVLLGCAAADMPRVRDDLPWHLTYTTNLLFALRGDWSTSLGHFWTLSIEEQFYLVWPAIILFVPARFLKAVVFGVIIVGPLSRACLVAATGNTVTSTFVTFSCMDSLGMGAMLAILGRDGGTRSHSRLIRGSLCIGLVLSLCVYAARFCGIGRHHGMGWWAIVTFMDLGYALMFVWLVDRAAEGFSGWMKIVLEWQPLVYTGTISYGVYVYHGVIPYFWNLYFSSTFGGIPNGTGAGRFLFVLALSCLVATVSWWFVEKPLNDLKKHFPYAGRRSASPLPTEGNRHPTPAQRDPADKVAI